MGGVGHQFSVRTEKGAGKIKTLFDVGRDGRFLKHATHLFGNGHKQIAENGKLHRVYLSPQFLIIFGAHLDFHVTEAGNGRPAIRLNQDGGRVMDNNGGPRDFMAGPEGFQVIAVSCQPSSK